MGVKKSYVMDGQGSKRTVYRMYKGNAERKGLPFTLVFEEFLKLVALPCYYCGKPPSNILKAETSNATRSGGDFIYQGIDREDNDQGYTRSNSVPCCFVCNLAKGKRSHREFLAWIIKVHKYSIEDVKRSG